MRQSEVDAREAAHELKKIELYVKDAASFQRVFNNPDGENVIKRLKQFVKPFDRDPYQNAYNTCAREIVDFVVRMSDDEEYNKHLDALNAQKEKK